MTAPRPDRSRRRRGILQGIPRPIHERYGHLHRTSSSSATAPSRAVTINRPEVLNALNSRDARRAAADDAGARRRRRRAGDGYHRGGGEVVRRRRRHQRAGGADADAAAASTRCAVSTSSISSSISASRSLRRSTATRSAAAASWRWPARSGSPPTPRVSASPRSISGSSPATAARSGWRAWSARAARSSCC